MRRAKFREIDLGRLRLRWLRNTITPAQFMAARLALVGCDNARIARHMGNTANDVAAILASVEQQMNGKIVRPSRKGTAEQRREELAAIYDEEALAEVCGYCTMRWHNADNCIAREQDRQKSWIGSALGAAA